MERIAVADDITPDKPVAPKPKVAKATPAKPKPRALKPVVPEQKVPSVSPTALEELGSAFSKFLTQSVATSMQAIQEMTSTSVNQIAAGADELLADVVGGQKKQAKVKQKPTRTKKARR